MHMLAMRRLSLLKTGHAGQLLTLKMHAVRFKQGFDR